MDSKYRGWRPLVSLSTTQGVMLSHDNLTWTSAIVSSVYKLTPVRSGWALYVCVCVCVSVVFPTKSYNFRLVLVRCVCLLVYVYQLYFSYSIDFISRDDYKVDQLRHSETSWDLWRPAETFRDQLRPMETSWDLRRPAETYGDRRPAETYGDQRPAETYGYQLRPLSISSHPSEWKNMSLMFLKRWLHLVQQCNTRISRLAIDYDYLFIASRLPWRLSSTRNSVSSQTVQVF